MVKPITLYLLLSVMFTATAWADTHPGVLFENSIVGGSYRNSRVSHDGRSWVENVAGRLPVCDSVFFTPGNSLSLKYSSAGGGRWEAYVAFPRSAGSYAVDTTALLSLKLYAVSDMAGTMLPRLALCQGDTVSHTVELADYVSDFGTDKWLDVRVPVAAFDSLDVHTAIEGIRLSQGEADTATHWLYVDQVEFLPANPPQVPLSSPAVLATAKAYQRHVDLTWQLPLTPSIRYIKVYRSEDKEHFEPVGIRPVFAQKYTDVVPYPERTYYYKITWVDYDYRESPFSAVMEATTRPAGDSELLDVIQAAHVNYFVEHTEVNSGMYAVHFGVDDATVSVMETGLGLLSYVVGADRGFISRRAVLGRLRRMVGFLEKVERYHGAFPARIDGRTGKGVFEVDSVPEADLRATSFLMQGLLAARQYFAADSGRTADLMARIDTLWNGVEWEKFTVAGQENILLDRWSPVAGFRGARPMGGFGNDFVGYILALASPDHALPPEAYTAGLGTPRELLDSAYVMELAANDSFAVDTGGSTAGRVLPNYCELPYTADTVVYGLPITVGSVDTSLMEAYTPFLAFDPRGKRDAYADYFVNNVNLTRAVKRRDNEQGYGFSTTVWGTTTVGTDSLDSLKAINPSVPAASYAYTPEAALQSIRELYETYGDIVFTEYGFRKWVAPSDNAVATGYDAFNQAAVAVMIENGRSGLIWNLFASHPDIKKVMEVYFDSE